MHATLQGLTSDEVSAMSQLVNTPQFGALSDTDKRLVAKTLRRSEGDQAVTTQIRELLDSPSYASMPAEQRTEALTKIQNMLVYGSFGLDPHAVELLATLETRIQEKFPYQSQETRAWMVNRIIGAFGYGESDMGDGIKWCETAGCLYGPPGPFNFEFSLKDVMISLGYTADDYAFLDKALREQSDAAPKNNFADLRHQAITTAANLFSDPPLSRSLLELESQ